MSYGPVNQWWFCWWFRRNGENVRQASLRSTFLLHPNGISPPSTRVRTGTRVLGWIDNWHGNWVDKFNHKVQSPQPHPNRNSTRHRLLDPHSSNIVADFTTQSPQNVGRCDVMCRVQTMTCSVALRLHVSFVFLPFFALWGLSFCCFPCAFEPHYGSTPPSLVQCHKYSAAWVFLPAPWLYAS